VKLSTVGLVRGKVLVAVFIADPHAIPPEQDPYGHRSLDSERRQQMLIVKWILTSTVNQLSQDGATADERSDRR
jgi:hypothetical protein